MLGSRVGIWSALMLVVVASSPLPARAGGGVGGGPGMGGHAFSPPIVPHGFFGRPNIPSANRHAGGVRPGFPRPFPPRHNREYAPFVGWGGAAVYAVPYAPYPDYAFSDSGYYDPVVGSSIGVTSMQAAPAPPPPGATSCAVTAWRFRTRGCGSRIRLPLRRRVRLPPEAPPRRPLRATASSTAGPTPRGCCTSPIACRQCHPSTAARRSRPSPEALPELPHG